MGTKELEKGDRTWTEAYLDQYNETGPVENSHTIKKMTGREKIEDDRKGENCPTSAVKRLSCNKPAPPPSFSISFYLLTPTPALSSTTTSLLSPHHW
jgi:hypothetical protein